MINYEVQPIGRICNIEEEVYVELDPQYLPALRALDGFSHINLVWWFSDFDDERSRRVLETEQPYKGAPETMGIFATRSPVRPNPIALSVVQVTDIDYGKGRIYITYTDANDGTPLLDIKPYTPSMDRVEAPEVPGWCNHWPKNIETSGEFDWAAEFNF